MMTETTTTVSDRIIALCRLAATGAAEDAEVLSIRAAHCDYNSRGIRRAHWYRMVWRGGAWQYFADSRMERVGVSASTRYQTVRGDVYPSEVVIGHDHGGRVDCAYLVCSKGDASDPTDVMIDCRIATTRDGQLKITLPDGSTVLRPDPRK